MASPQTHFRWNVSVSKSHSVYEISQYFFHWFKALPLMANNLILATSFGFKLNSNLKENLYLHIFRRNGFKGLNTIKIIRIFLKSLNWRWCQYLLLQLLTHMSSSSVKGGRCDYRWKKTHWTHNSTRGHFTSFAVRKVLGLLYRFVICSCFWDMHAFSLYISKEQFEDCMEFC